MVLYIKGPDQEDSLQYWRKSKAATGVNNTASYIAWLYSAWGQMVAGADSALQTEFVEFLV